MKRRLLILLLSLVVSSGVYYGFYNQGPQPLPRVLGEVVINSVGTAVGVTAEIEPNYYNTLDQQLNARQVELDQRESFINFQANNLVKEYQQLLTFMLIWGVVLTALVLLNFYFDRRRLKFRY